MTCALLAGSYAGLLTKLAMMGGAQGLGPGGQTHLGSESGFIPYSLCDMDKSLYLSSLGFLICKIGATAATSYDCVMTAG